MTLHRSNYAKGTVTVPYPSFAGAVVAQRFVFAAPATLASGDIIDLAPIPVGCRVVDMILDSDDLDTGTPAILLDVGIMSGVFGDTDPARTCGAEFFSGSTVAQAGTIARPTLKTAFRTSPSGVERSIGVKVATVAATPAAGTIGLTVLFATE